MSRQRKPTPTPPSQRLITRRVRAAHLTYPVRVPGPDGRIVQVLRDANQGDAIEADPFTIMVYDSAGGLAPPGASREQVQAEADEMVERYRAARRSVGGVV